MAHTCSAPYVVGAGKHRFEVHEEWAPRLDEMEVLAASVTVDSKDRVYCFGRNKAYPVTVFDREGNFLSSWGANEFAFPHTIRADKDDNLWIVDRDHGQMYLYTPEGRLLRTIGERGFRSDTGVKADDFRSDAYKDVTHGGGPFNLPTDIDVAPSGEMFMTDGYGNARVHKYSADGKYLFSWGEPGTGPGQFNLPHAVWITRDGRLLICDRENDRVQVFDQGGKLLKIWPTKMIGPAVIYVDKNDIVYIPEHNAGLISVLTLEGERLAQWGDPSFRSCHGIWGDSHGDIYVVRAGPWGRRRRVVKHVRVQ
jgi:DNA-binding beta-propeller fold protein YncE